MKAKPMLFQGDMVRAILDGSKTQTRRIVKPQPPSDSDGAFYNPSAFEPDRGWYWNPHGGFAKCPYGQPGDLIWVRETWGVFDQGFDGPGESEFIVYRSDEQRPDPDRWRPSIHMPRWASRLTLEVTDLRVERVQEISDSDALAEGIQWSDWLEGYHAGEGRHFHCSSPRRSFESLWESINAPRGYGWDANPWVWVIEFRAIHDNVDNVLRYREAT